MNAANEIAVELFLQGKTSFLSIPDIIEGELDRHNSYSDFDLESIISIDKETRNNLRERFKLQ